MTELKKLEGFEQLARIFQHLGHPTKLRLLKRLMDSPTDSCVPTILAVEMDLSVSAVSYSLMRLTEIGLVKRTSSGRYSFYKIERKVLEDIREFLR